MSFRDGNPDLLGMSSDAELARAKEEMKRTPPASAATVPRMANDTTEALRDRIPPIGSQGWHTVGGM